MFGEDLEKIYNEANIVAMNMQKFGCSFVNHLGAALEHADINNIHKIKNAFPQYWNEYLTWGK